VSENQNQNKSKERVLTPEEQAFEDNLLKVISDAIGIQIKACGMYKVMFVPNGDDKSGTMMFVMFPANNDGYGIAMDFTDVAKLVMELANEYIQKHPVSPTSTKLNERLMVF
jgi:hypothetical protein